MIFSFSHRNRALSYLFFVTFINSISLSPPTHASTFQESSEIIEELTSHGIGVAGRESNSQDADFYEEDIRAHLLGEKNATLQKVLNNIQMLKGIKRAGIDKSRLMDRLGDLDTRYKHYWYGSREFYFISTQDFEKAIGLERERITIIRKLTLELKYTQRLLPEEKNKKEKELFIAKHDLTHGDLCK